MAGPQEVDWDRLDKRKFFFVGVGMFSGVTTVLYPLTVIKTRQMAAHRDVAAGMSGARLVASQILKQDGVRGFYRGFGTVVFGTIPARAVYMTTLEVTKSAVTRLGQRFDITPAALAGAASFFGGAAASASTQAVVVPIDVVSQRLMMHGLGDASVTAAATTTTAGGNSSSRPAAGAMQQPGAAAPAAAAAPAGQHSGSRRSYHTGGSRSGSRAGPSAALHQQQQQRQLWRSAAAQQHSSSVQQPCMPCSSSSSSSSSSRARGARAMALRQQQRQRHAAAAAPPMNGLRMAQLIVAQEGVAGLYRGFWPSLATFVPNSALWWGAYGFWQRTLWEQLAPNNTGSSSSSSGGGPSTGMVVAVQTSAALLSGCTASLLTNPLDLVKTRLQVAEPVGGAVPSWRQVLKELLAEEGPRGLLRGVAPRMASSAMWGTAMVSVYEFLKRLCALPPQ